MFDLRLGRLRSSRTLLSASAGALAAGAVFLVGTGISLKQLNFAANPVRVPVTQWTESFASLAAIELGGDHVFAETAPAILPELARYPFPTQAAQSYSPMPVLAYKPVMMPARQVHAARTARVVVQSVGSVPRPDTLVLAQSATMNDSDTLQASAADLLKMRAMYRTLHGQFLAALDPYTAPTSPSLEELTLPVTTQVVSHVVSQVERPAAVEVKESPSSVAPVARRVRAVRIQPVLARPVSHALAPAPSGQPKISVEKTTDHLQITVAHAETQPLLKGTTNVTTQLSPSSGVSNPAAQVATSEPTPFKTPYELLAEMGSQLFKPATNDSSGGYPGPVEYPNIRVGQLSQGRVVKHDERDYPQPVPAPVLTAPIVEAFDWSTPVSDATSEYLTTEGWKILRSPSHWASIYWNPSKIAPAQGALISFNTAKTLGELTGSKLQSEAALIFGKIPSGYTVEFSGRSEKPLYLDEHNQVVSPGTGGYFAFLNSEPGAQVVTLRVQTPGPDEGSLVSVALPAVSGHATYLDLTEVNQRTLSGLVLDASSPQAALLKDIDVSVVGQPTLGQRTNSSGGFEMRLRTIGTYPVFVETRVANQFQHRYRLAPSRLEHVSLFRFGGAQIQEWLGQLEGGLSPESGLVVGAVPALAGKFSEGQLYPVVRPLIGKANLTPETYTLATSGQLETNQALDRAGAARFVSVQVPEGLVVTQIEDTNRKTLWSQLIVAQPGVVNVIGEF